MAPFWSLAIAALRIHTKESIRPSIDLILFLASTPADDTLRNIPVELRNNGDQVMTLVFLPFFASSFSHPDSGMIINSATASVASTRISCLIVWKQK